MKTVTTYETTTNGMRRIDRMIAPDGLVLREESRNITWLEYFQSVEEQRLRLVDTANPDPDPDPDYNPTDEGLTEADDAEPNEEFNGDVCAGEAAARAEAGAGCVKCGFFQCSCHGDRPSLSLTEEEIERPAHYTLGQEVFPFIASWGMSFAAGNVIKYVVRHPHKGKPLSDLMKARWYLDRLIDEAKAG